MVFSTQDYHVKPIVPPIIMGFSLNGIVLRRFNSRSALLLSEQFKRSSRYYFENDLDFAKKLKEYIRKMEFIKEAILRQSFHEFRKGHSTLTDFELVDKPIDEILNKIVHEVISPDDLCFSNRITNEYIASTKELDFWLKKVFNHRKRKIKQLYSKKEFLEFNTLLNACNGFLKTLGQQSLKLTNTLNLFFDIGSEIDWFLLNITECDYHKSLEFKQLFSSNIRVNNDLVSIFGILNILNQSSTLELYLIQEESTTEMIRQYKDTFHELLISGNRVIDLEISNRKAKSNVNALLKKVKQYKDTEEKLQEIQSMHEVAIDRKIHDIE